MAILDLYEHSQHRREIGHFANIIKIANADEVITDDEQKLLDRLAFHLNITKKEYGKIKANPDNYPIHPPVEYDARIERLFDLIRMIFADKEVILKEVTLVRKTVVGLGFPLDNVEKITDEAIHLIMNRNNLVDFTKAIKNVNKR